MLMFFISINQPGSHSAEHRAQRKIIKGLSKMGTSTLDAQRLCRRAVKEEESLDAETIDFVPTLQILFYGLAPRASLAGGSNNKNAQLVLDAVISPLRSPYMEFAEAFLLHALCCYGLDLYSLPF